MLRYYEAQGLLQPGRHPNGYRDYSESDLNQVVTIRDLSRSGVPTRFIKIVLDRQSGQSGWSSTCDDILARMVTEQIDDLDTKIACLTTSRVVVSGLSGPAGAGNRRFEWPHLRLSGQVLSGLGGPT
jgi:DNA-binding transcriptional MerR regulator